MYPHEVALDVVAAAAGVGHVERNAVRQLALDADRGLVHVRHDEIRIREARIAAEEGERAERAAGRVLDPGRPRVRKRVGRRPAAVERRDDRRVLEEPGIERLTGRVQEVLAPAGAEHGFVVDRVGRADPELVVVLVVLPRPIRGAVDAREPDAAQHLLIDARRHWIDQRRIERVVQHVVFFRHRAVEVPPEAEVQRPLVVDPASRPGSTGPRRTTCSEAWG